MRIYHLDCYTPDIFGYTDNEWIKYKVNFGPNYVLSRLNQEEKWNCSVHYFTKGRELKKEVINHLPFMFHPVSFPFLPAWLTLGKGSSIPFYRHQLQFSLPFFKYLKSFHPDLIIINITSGISNYIVGYYAKKHNIPYVAHLHGGDYWGSPVRHKFMRNASAVVVTSEYEKSQISERYRISPRKITTIPVGVDTNKFQPLKLESNRRHFPNLLYVGRIVRGKGVHEIVKCLRNILSYFPHAHLGIVGPVGDKQYFSKIQDYITKNEINSRVTFHGTISNDKLPAIYNKSDLFIFPSLKEGNPAVVMESMSCGTPVLALKGTGGHNEVIINNKNGILTEPENLSSDIVNLLKDRVSLREFSQKGRQRIVNYYSFENTFRKHKELYVNILCG